MILNIAWEVTELTDKKFDFEVVKVPLNLDVTIYSVKNVYYTEEKIYIDDSKLGEWSWNWHSWDNDGCTVNMNVYYVK